AFDYKVILVVPAPRGPAFGRPEDRLRAAKRRNPESWRNSWVPAFAGTTTKILEPSCVHAVAPRGEDQGEGEAATEIRVSGKDAARGSAPSPSRCCATGPPER